MAVFPRRTTPLDDDGQPRNRFLSRARVNDRDIDEMMGICRGMLADGAVNQTEAEFLLKWITQNVEVADTWPGNVIYPRLYEMLSDGVLDDEEERELLDLLMTNVGSPRFSAEGMKASTALPFDDPAPRVTFHGEVFCLTGKFVGGTRRELEDAVAMRGGKCKTAPCKKTSFLVIGEIASRDWIHSNFGRKIQKAIELRDGGAGIAIIPEERFFDYLHG
jgi:NAD-dependent DNA ligase